MVPFLFQGVTDVYNRGCRRFRSYEISNRYISSIDNHYGRLSLLGSPVNSRAVRRCSRVGAISLMYPFRDINHYVTKQSRYSDLIARRMMEQGRKFSCHQMTTHPLGSFLKMYVLRGGFLGACQT